VEVAQSSRGGMRWGLGRDRMCEASSFPSPLFPWLINHPSSIPANVSCLMRDTLATDPAWDCLLSRCSIGIAPCTLITFFAAFARPLRACSIARALDASLAITIPCLVACTTAALEHLRRLYVMASSIWQNIEHTGSFQLC
jgi:hypothetical protein